MIKGTTLLDHKGSYAASLNTEETIFLSILQKKSDVAFLNFKIPGKPIQRPIETDMIGFTAADVDTEIKASYRNDRFRFEIKVDMPVSLSERLFSFNMQQNKKELEEEMSKQAEQKMKKLIEKIQKHKIDPIGLGLYARAYEYKSYKKVEERWGEALSEAEIDVTVDVTIIDSGPIK